ncbi:carbohydrate kinase [Devosia sp. MC521]|uniref:carbohydrate kinase family protein n=1 Tax=Devosia sp. MC521 TaxID=2759954 RepID=UPI0015FC3674|nr:carbohydrate kinase [Devosia sp. MC521]MBJ6988902.1 carbohydrate kinase [Devosia sp. MC521]QMW62251.1 carbohydrate kinase [Devosia sp. MC521]
MFVVGGESLVDLVPVSNAPDADRQALPGGSPMNCAIAIAKLGNKSGFMCPISQDEYGDMLLKPLAAAGVEVLVKERVAAPTTKAIVSFNEKMQASYVFERGADRAFTRDSLLKALPSTLELFQIGGFCPILAEDAVVWDEVVKSAIGRGATISIDINVREKLVDDEAGYRQRLSRFLDLAHIIKLSEEDHDWLSPGLSIEEHAKELLSRPNSELVVVTLGEGGSIAFSHAGHAKAPIYSPPVFGDTVGAGDSLMAGILTWLYEADVLKAHSLLSLNDEQLEDMLEFGAVVAGINCGRKGCQPPTRSEVEQVMSEL